MDDVGVTTSGFVLKPFDAILADAFARAKEMFGADVDLSATSPIRKLLEISAAEDAATWQRLEDLYYGGFASSAVGDELDLIGEGLGIARRQLFAQGTVTAHAVSPPQPDRSYTLPEGTIFVSAPGGAKVHTTAAVTLTGTAPRDLEVQAFDRGRDVPAGATFAIDPVYALLYLELQPPTTVTATNAAALTGGAEVESDEAFRARILGLPRNIWTVESVRSAVREVDGVTDVALFDPLGGVDVSQSYFNLFTFNERLFSGERRIGEAYFFDVVVAHQFARPWRTETIPPLVGAVTGIFENVLAAVERVRPVGVHPNVIEANHIEVGVRAQAIVEPGYELHREALLAAFREQLAADVGTLKLGGDVLYSQVMRTLVEQPGVVDVQHLHLRRCPAAFGRITFGDVPFQSAVIELAAGDNVAMGPREVAIFRLDSALTDIELVPR
jgi:uncharacterized phage protein gp47/JayE